jgi:hypothetical protein
VPPSTEARIERITARIRALCSGPFKPEAEAELRKLAQDLRAAIRQHLGLAKRSLSAKKAAIKENDPDSEER